MQDYILTFLEGLVVFGMIYILLHWLFCGL